MNSIFKPGFSAKLIHLVTLPLLAALWFGGSAALGDLDVHHDARDTVEMAELAGRVGDVVHELQGERGLSAGFIAGDASAMASLAGRRRAADEKIALLRAGAAHEGPVADAMAAADRELAGLAQLRGRVDGRELPAAQSSSAYSALIKKLLFVAEIMPGLARDVGTAQALSAYDAILAAKERTGQERALLNAVLAADAITAQQLTSWNGLRASQDAYLDQALGLESPTVRERHQAVYSDPGYRAVDELRAKVRAVIESGQVKGFGIAPKTWFQTMTAHIDRLAGLEDEAAASVVAIADARLSKATRDLVVVLVTLGVLVGLCAFAGVTLARSIRRPVVALAAALDRVKNQRDLAARVSTEGNDELATMGRAFNGFMDELQRTLSGIKGGTDRLRASATSLQELGRGLVDAAGTATTESHTAGASAEEVSAGASVVANATSQLAQATQEIAGTTSRMSQSTRGAVDAMQRNQAVMTRLEESGDAIVRVVRVIANIAGQTNLLALNAAIEAASAGEYGRGFSVVADEVKALSNETQKATTDIERQVNGIRDALSEAVTVNRSVASALSEASLAQATVAAAVEEQSATTSDLSQNIGAIAAGSRDIANSIVNVANIARATNDAATHTASASEELMRVAVEVEGLVARLVAA